MLPPPFCLFHRQFLSGRSSPSLTFNRSTLGGVTSVLRIDRTSPMTPLSTNSFARRCMGWCRNLNASASKTPFRCAAAAIRSASLVVSAKGFSQRIALTLLDSAICMVVSACAGPQVETIAMSISSVANISFRLVYRGATPNSSPNDDSESSDMSQIAHNSVESTSLHALPCRVAMLPVPTMAT